MRLIKLAILSFIFLFAVVTAISLLIPSHIRISKAINIGAPQESIFYFIKDESRWPLWYPAFMQKDSFRKKPQIEVSPKSVSDSELVFQLQQADKMPLINGWKIYHHSSTDSLTLQWYSDFHLKWYPWQKFGSLFYENTYGVMMQQGLSNLKKLAEK
ncbi:MAG: hypothetical protein ACTHMD_11500 [Flavisolibacter sp.]